MVKIGEKRKFVKFAVALLRNTTWRCGKIERLIIKHLHKKTTNFGKSEIPISDMLQSFEVPDKKKNEFLNALKRLERRNIIRILSIGP